MQTLLCQFTIDSSLKGNKFRTTIKHFCEPKNGSLAGRKIPFFLVVGLMVQIIFHDSGGGVAKCIVTALDCGSRHLFI